MKKALLLFLIIIVSFSIICFTCLDVKADSNDCFTGCIGSPNGSMLYSATNTYQYNWNIVSSNNNHNYNISEWGTLSLNGSDIIAIEGVLKLNSILKIRLILSVL